MSEREITRRGILLVLSSPSGAGKTTITRELVQRDPQLHISVSVTTRPPRKGEVDGQHYHFVKRARFDEMVGGGELLEHASVFGHFYGTPRAPVEAALAAGRDVLFDIEWQGHRQLRTTLPGDVVGVFLLPPSLEELERRLRGRGQDGEEEIARRMQAARDEMLHWDEFDHVLVNRDFAETVATVRAILHAARTQRVRQPWLPDFIASLLKG